MRALAPELLGDHVRRALVTQRLQVGFADHAAIGDHHERPQGQPVPELLAGLRHARHVRLPAREQPVRQRDPLPAGEEAQVDLLAVRPVIAAVAVARQLRADPSK